MRLEFYDPAEYEPDELVDEPVYTQLLIDDFKNMTPNWAYKYSEVYESNAPDFRVDFKYAGDIAIKSPVFNVITTSKMEALESVMKGESFQ